MILRAHEPRAVTRRAGLAAVLAATLLAVGCASPTQVSPQAASYGTWPSDRDPGTFAFERLPSQQARPVAQDKLEVAAAAALERAGFKPAASAAEAEVLVVAGSRWTTVAVRDYWDWDPRFGVRGFVGYGRHWSRSRWGFGGYWGVPVTQTAGLLEVSLVMRDRKTQTVIHEARARYDQPWNDPRLVEALFDAALKGFPTPAAPRTVTVPLPAGAVAEAPDKSEPAAAPASAPKGSDKPKDAEKSSALGTADRLARR